MGRPKGVGSERTGRPAMRSPGRPPAGRREHRARFWAAIARGLSSEDAARAGGSVGGRWRPVLSGGWRDVNCHPGPVVEALSVVRGAGGDRDAVCWWVWGAGDRASARALAVEISRELRRNAATSGGGLAYRASTAQWHADRRAQRPKPAMLAVNGRLREYVQDRLLGVVQRPEGTAVAGPEVRWVGRRLPQSPKIHPDAKIKERECAHMRGETRARRDGRVRAPQSAVHAPRFALAVSRARRETGAFRRAHQRKERPWKLSQLSRPHLTFALSRCRSLTGSRARS